MISSPASASAEPEPSAVVLEFAARHYGISHAADFGIALQALARILAGIVRQRDPDACDVPELTFLSSLRLEELVLSRACADGNDLAWEVFLNRYRDTLYETAYKVAKEDSAAHGLADSLYAELYGVDGKGQQRRSKLLYYQGRGSLQGWLRTVVAQEWVNRCRNAKRETSLDEQLEQGAQFQAPEPKPTAADARIEAAVGAELATLDAEDRFLLVAYFLDQRTLAEIAKLLRVHESTISRRLERTTLGLRKRICKRLVQAGMSKREADEVMEDVDVRDLQVRVTETLRQEMPDISFYKHKEPQG